MLVVLGWTVALEFVDGLFAHAGQDAVELALLFGLIVAEVQFEQLEVLLVCSCVGHVALVVDDLLPGRAYCRHLALVDGLGVGLDHAGDVVAIQLLTFKHLASGLALDLFT